uniref:Uncharacterized protein n=1 Tax=Romanomermis culicivorax TaxID=13658 RepID=A0A915KGK9_ROMCU
MQNFNINEDHSPPLPPPPPMMIGDSSTVADDFRQNYDSVGGNSTTAKFQLQSSTPNFDVAGSSRQDSSPADQAIWVPQTYMEKGDVE